MSLLETLSPEQRRALAARLLAERTGRAQRSEWDQPRSHPVSPAQRRLWFLDQLRPGSPVYNVARDVRLEGPLASEALAAALAAVVRRHPALRTTFEAGPEHPEPVAVVAPPAPVPLPLADFAGLPPERCAAEAERLAAASAARPFDLARGPLLRAALVRLPPDPRAPAVHRLLIALHHVVADAWSMGVLFRDLAAFYDAGATGRPAALPLSPASYEDFARRQRERLESGALEPQLAWWRQRLAGAPALLELPADRPRPPVQSLRGASRPVTVPPALAAGLRELGRAHRATPFMTGLAAFTALLGRFAGVVDLVVGTPLANRDRADSAEAVGFFLSTLALRADLSGDPPFSELLRRTRDSALAAYAHAEAPFERLVEELRPERGLAHAPLFQVMFVLDAAPPARLEGGGVAFVPAAVPTGTAKFDLLLALEDDGRALGGYCEYSTDLFEAATIDRLLGSYLRLLAAAVADPATRLSELPLLAEAERRQLLDEWGEGGPVLAADAIDTFAAVAARQPEAAAVAAEGERLSYAELERRARRLAGRLAAAGAGPGARVAVLLPRGLGSVVATLATLMTGAACVPLDPAWPRERVGSMLADARAGVVVRSGGREEGKDRKDAEDGKDLEDGGDLGELVLEIRGVPEVLSPIAWPSPDDLAYVVYTSGSTGRPKGVGMTSRGLAALVGWHLADPVLGRPARTLQFASPSFDVFFQELFTTWCAGGCLVLVSEARRRDPAALLERIGAESVERLFLPVVALEQLAEAAEGAPALVRLADVITAGEQLRVTRQVAGLLARIPGVRLHNHYGPSESHVVTAWTMVGDPYAFPALPPIGRPVPGARVVVLGPGLEPAPAGVPGELFIGGDVLARGYLDRPDETAARFRPDPFAGRRGEPGARLYATGDRARVRPDGVVEYLGRLDDQVKLRGYRVEPGEIEALLAAHPAVRDAAVAVRGGDDLGSRRLIACVVPAEGGSASEGAGRDLAAGLRAFLAERLPDYMVPAAFALLPALPLTPSGKVDRRRLPEPEASPALERALPRTPAEEAVAAVWREVLGRAEVGVDEDFFALGGHSLLATRVVARVRRALGVDLPLAALFEAPTVAGLARAAERLAEAGGAVRPRIAPLARPPLRPEGSR